MTDVVLFMDKPVTNVQSINLSINQLSIAPLSQAKPGSVARQPNQCSTVISRKQFRNINRLIWLNGQTAGGCSKETGHKSEKLLYLCWS